LSAGEGRDTVGKAISGGECSDIVEYKGKVRQVRGCRQTQTRLLVVSGGLCDRICGRQERGREDEWMIRANNEYRDKQWLQGWRSEYVRERDNRERVKKDTIRTARSGRAVGKTAGDVSGALSET
jgi:hypothetical protein